MSSYDLIAIGASAGGLRALPSVLGALPGDTTTAVVIVQHMSPDVGDSMVQHLRTLCALPVDEAVDKQPVSAGVVYVASPGYHLLIERDRYFALSLDPPVHHSRPAIDVLFECAAEVYGARAVGVLLTGANSDGTRGMQFIHEHGGLTVVQDPDTAHCEHMPRAAIRAVKIDHILPLSAIAPLLGNLAGSPSEAHSRECTETVP